MLLCSVKCHFWSSQIGLECSVELADYCSFEAADDLLGLTFLCSAGHVLLCRFVPAQSVDDDQVDRAVGVTVTAAV
jgi:hypothetical protein